MKKLLQGSKVPESKNKYSTGFKTGTLLVRESEAVIDALNDFGDFMDGKEGFDSAVLSINSEASKKRIKHELEKRIRNLKSPEFLSLFQDSDEKNKSLILFYAAAKSYGLISDFLLESVLPKWNNQDLKITKEDFLNYLFVKEDAHPELEDLTQGTRKNLATVTLRMLKEVQIVRANKLQKQKYELPILQLIYNNNDMWFLDAIFLNTEEKKAVASL